MKWNDPDEDGLIQFLVNEKGFSEERVRNGVQKLKKARGSSVQGRLTSFFGEPTVVKRKVLSIFSCFFITAFVRTNDVFFVRKKDNDLPDC